MCEIMEGREWEKQMNETFFMLGPCLPEISGGLIDPSMKMKTGKYKCSPFDMGSLCSRKIIVPV